MADKSAIEWTDATWNPIVGCSIVSPGCTHCYAMGMAARIEAMTAALRKEGKTGAPHYDGTTRKVTRRAATNPGGFARPSSPLVGEDSKAGRAEGEPMAALGEGSAAPEPYEHPSPRSPDASAAPQRGELSPEAFSAEKGPLDLSERSASKPTRGEEETPALGKTIWTGKLALAPEAILLEPLAWKRPRKIFVNSMGDLFHEDVPDEWIDRVFAVMALAPQHTFQVLTKRAKRMREYVSRIDGNELEWKAWRCTAAQILRGLGREDEATGDGPRWPLPNIWFGVSAERQQEADERIPELLATPAAIRFVSAEPLLGPIDFGAFGLAVHHHPDNDHASPHVQEMVRKGREYLAREFGTGIIGWIIAGGESGPNARPMHPAWPRAIRDQCAAAGVPFFFKQWGAWAPGENALAAPTRTEQTATWFDERWIYESVTPAVSAETHVDDAPDLYRLGKKAAGRLLDGVEHNAFPQTRD